MEKFGGPISSNGVRVLEDSGESRVALLRAGRYTAKGSPEGVLPKAKAGRTDSQYRGGFNWSIDLREVAP